MEDNSTFNSGKGAKVNEKFECELDSSIMDGKSLKCGAVAGLQHIKNPINAARLVMEKSKHILLVGKAAEEFAQSHGETIVPNKYFMTPIEIKEWYDIRSDSTKKIPQHETCGCIVLDTEGHLAAGTTTGGVTNKMSGRVGDSPIIGAGTYANDDSIAVSCTGLGENMIRRSFAFDLRARMLYKNQTLEQAGKDAMSELEPLTGGYISIDNKGNVYAPFNSPGMARAYVRQDGKAKIILFTPETDFYPCDYDIEKEYQEQQAKKDL